MRNYTILICFALAACSTHKSGSPAVVDVPEMDAGAVTTATSCASWGAQAGAPRVLGKSLPRAMGGFVRSSCGTGGGIHMAGLDPGAVAGTGDTLYLPVLPLFDNNPMTPAFLTPPKILKVGSDGTVSDFYVFPAAEASSFASHFYSAATIDGMSGNIPRGVAVSVVADAAGNVYYANSLGSTVYRFDTGGMRSDFATNVPQLLSLALGPDGAIYGATGAFFSGPTLMTPPRIVKIDAAGTVTTVATLPSSYTYATGFYGTAGQPIGLMIDLAFDGAANLYVTVNMAGVVLKIASDGDGGVALGGGGAPVEYAKGIDAPSGIAAASDGRLLVAQGPLFSTAGGTATLTSNPKVIAVALDGTQSTFFAAPANDAYNTHFFSAPGPNGAYPVDAVFKLAADATGNVFYEDALVNQVTVLPKQ